jgi:hypothetical protein
MLNEKDCKQTEVCLQSFLEYEYQLIISKS